MAASACCLSRLPLCLSPPRVPSLLLPRPAATLVGAACSACWASQGLRAAPAAGSGKVKASPLPAAGATLRCCGTYLKSRPQKLSAAGSCLCLLLFLPLAVSVSCWLCLLLSLSLAVSVSCCLSATVGEEANHPFSREEAATPCSSQPHSQRAPEGPVLLRAAALGLPRACSADCRRGPGETVSLSRQRHLWDSPLLCSQRGVGAGAPPRRLRS